MKKIMIEITIIYNTRDWNENIINVLLLEDENKEYFVWIKDLSKLMCMNTHKHKKEIGVVNVWIIHMNQRIN